MLPISIKKRFHHPLGRKIVVREGFCECDNIGSRKLGECIFNETGQLITTNKKCYALSEPLNPF